eukprot:2065266-Amphidinium_carterae.1
MCPCNLCPAYASGTSLVFLSPSTEDTASRTHQRAWRPPDEAPFDYYAVLDWGKDMHGAAPKQQDTQTLAVTSALVTDAGVTMSPEVRNGIVS